MWIVRLALRRPYTFTVMAILIVLMGIVTISRMATDIFPKIDIPVVSVIWSFPGVAPEEMEKRFVTVTERAMTTTVNDIEHIESQSYNGVSVIKVFFHEGAKVEAGVAQVTSITQTLLRILPPGTTPPLILQYSASNVPILQLGLTSKTLSEQQLYDLGLNFISIRRNFSAKDFPQRTSVTRSMPKTSSFRPGRRKSATANTMCG
jgi:multidrug efflux pump subunit AcrB